MKKIIDNIILIVGSNKLNIGSINVSLHREISFNNINKLHYSGNISKGKDIIPKSLQNLLKEKEESINTGVFSILDELDEQINSFDLFLERNNIRIYDLYIENDGVEFTILNKN